MVPAFPGFPREVMWVCAVLGPVGATLTPLESGRVSALAQVPSGPRTSLPKGQLRLPRPAV